jgi:hypothetical protein
MSDKWQVVEAFVLLFRRRRQSKGCSEVSSVTSTCNACWILAFAAMTVWFKMA